jgi:hypothetical protein
MELSSEEVRMYARVVRFTDVGPETIDRVVGEIEASDGPPPGVAATAMNMLHDAEQGTALFVAFFETAEDMRAADGVFEDMDPSDTPGTRLSVDRCEVVIDRQLD